MEHKQSEAIGSVLGSFLRAIECVMEQFRTLAVVTAKTNEVSSHNVMFQEQCTLAFRDVVALIGALRRDFMSLTDGLNSAGDIEPPSPVVESLKLAADPPLYPDVFEAMSPHNDSCHLSKRQPPREDTTVVVPTPPKNPAPRQAPRPPTETALASVRRSTSEGSPMSNNRHSRPISERVDELLSLLYQAPIDVVSEGSVNS